MEAVDAVMGSRTFAAAFVALWIAGSCKRQDLMIPLGLSCGSRNGSSENAATVATRVGVYHVPLYSSVNSSLVWVIVSVERGFSPRRMYGCTEVPYNTSDHSFSLPVATA